MHYLILWLKIAKKDNNQIKFTILTRFTVFFYQLTDNASFNFMAKNH